MTGRNAVYREVDAPLAEQIPVVFEVPHASLRLPDGAIFNVSADEILQDSDVAMDEVCARVVEAGAAFFSAQFSRYVVDLNRAPDDIDLDTVPDHPTARGQKRRGVVWSETGQGRRFVAHIAYRDFLTRVATYHAPYHRRLRELLLARRRRFGFVILVAAHSMPSIGAYGEVRAMVVPGTRGGTTCSNKVRSAVESHFLAQGLSVVHDNPYRGGYCTQHYGVPEEGFHAIQIELNRSLYLRGASTTVVDNQRIEALQEAMCALAQKLGALTL